MNTKQFKEIQLFVRRAMFGEPETTGKVKRFTIVHLGSKGQDNGGVGFVPVDSEATTDDVDNIINEIEQIVQADADGVGTDQRYTIRPQFANINFKSDMRHILKVEAQKEDSGDTDENGAPTSTPGLPELVAMQMRHIENLHRLSVGAPAALLNQSQRTISRLQDTVTELHEKLIEGSGERLKIVTTLEGLLSQQQQRQLDALAAEKKMELVDKMGGQLMALAPAIVNKISGKNVFPQATTPAEEFMKQWFKSVTKEQFTAMCNALTPEQQFPMLMMYEEVRKVLDKEEEMRIAKESAKRSPSSNEPPKETEKEDE